MEKISINKLPYSNATKQILCKHGQRMKLKKYLEDHTENKSSSQNVVLGIVIENYSDKNLEMLSHHQSDYNVIVNNGITDIEPFSEYTFVMDNNNYLHRGVLGSMSWKMTMGDDSFRFVLTYFESYR